MLGNIWEALSPDPCLSPYETDYRWLTQVYESVKPPSGNGRLLWHALGAKTVELINENVHVESVRDDVETLVMDAQVLEDILKAAEPGKKAKEIEIKLIARLRKHFGNPKFTELGERLEKIKERHEQGFLTSLEFLKQMLELAKDVVEAEKQAEPETERNKAKEALTELFNEAKGSNTHIIVERIVDGHRRHREESALSPTGSTRVKASAWCKKNSAARCSNTSSTRTRSCSTKPTATSGSITNTRRQDVCS